MHTKNVRGIFKDGKKEPGYSAGEFVAAASYFQKTLNSSTVRKRAIKYGLAVDLETVDGLKGKKAGHLIPESRLEALMEEMGVKTSVEEFQEKLEFGRENSGVNRKYRASRIRI